VEAGTSVADAYVALALRLRRLVPELVNAGAADPAVCRAVAAEPLPTAALLVRQAGRLAETLPGAGLDPTRERFLAGQLHAVEWRARRLAGQAVPFDREVRACLDVIAVPGEPDVYRAAHRALDTLLPGAGSLAARLAAHRRREAVPPERLDEAVRALAAALRVRVTGRYGLPPDEVVELCLVPDAPWSAMQTYGGYRSVVQVNARAGLQASRLPRLVAHETYPGHHTECCRAQLGGRPELAVTVLGTPQTVVSEGLAEHALDVAVGPGWGRWSADVLAAVGVHTDGELAERLAPALEVLRRVRQDAALLLHGAGSPSADAAAAAEEHLRRWLLLDPVRARRVVDALARPLWRTQVVATVAGAQLVGERLAGSPDAMTEHRRMLDEPVLPVAVGS
jgi:hypothetical protein